MPEEELGATVIDMGGGLTAFAMFEGGVFTYSDRLPIGGSHVTSDLARGLGTPLAHAERLKCLYGQAMASHLDERDLVTVPSLGPDSGSRGDEDEEFFSNASGGSRSRDSQQIPKAFLARIIRPRMEEIFELLAQKIAAAPRAPIMEGRAVERFVLTGGASQLPGVRELAEQILGRPVRLAAPRPLPGMEDFSNLPAFATAMGLVAFTRQPMFASANAGPGLVSRIKHWVKTHV